MSRAASWGQSQAVAPLLDDGSDGNHERRRFSRVAVRCRCWIERESVTLFGTTADIGLGGLFLRTGVRLRAGSEVNVLIRLEGVSRSVVAQGVVAWNNPPSAGARRVGIGIQFSRIIEGEAELNAFLGAQGD